MIALHRSLAADPVPASRGGRLVLPFRLRAAWPILAWGCRWFGLGLGLGMLTDLVVRLVA